MNYSNKEYKKLGDRIRSNPKDISDEDYLMLQELRLTYKDPLAVIFTSIEKMAYTPIVSSVLSPSSASSSVFLRCR